MKSVTIRLLVCLMSFAICFAAYAGIKDIDVERLFDSSTGRLTVKDFDGGFRIEVQDELPAQDTVRIGRFHAKSQTIYSVGLSAGIDKCTSKGQLILKVRWLDSKGKDLAEIEERLGYKQCTLSAIEKLSGDSSTVSLKVLGQASRERCETGIIELILPSGTNKGASFNLSGLSVKEGIPESDIAKNTGAAGGDVLIATPPPGFNFAGNLLPNASFEDGGGSAVTGWHYEGKGVTQIGEGAYAGKRCLLLNMENDGKGVWISDYSEVKPGLPVWFSYWIRFNELANPGIQPTPVKIEFFKKDGDKMVKLPSVNYSSDDFRFDLSGQCLQFYGQWIFRFFGPISIPAGATHLRGTVDYRNNFNGRLGNWGDMRVDNVAAWQNPQENALNFEQKSPDYGKFLRATASGKALPPFIPVGASRENSVGIFSKVIQRTGFYLAGESKSPELDVCLVNYLPVERDLKLEFKISDWTGAEVRCVKDQASLPPFAVVRKRIPLEASMKFGVYSVECKALEVSKESGTGILHFAWMEKPIVSDSERLSADYPFCMHPYRINADNQCYSDPEFIDNQLGILKLVGVKAIRLQSRYVYNGLDLKNMDASVKGAQMKVESWRKNVLPLMRKHGIEGWVSLMEQELPPAPRTEDELKVWYQYNYEMFKMFGSDITSYFFGNEGLWGWIPENPDEMLTNPTYKGSTRDWMISYKVAREAAKAVNPNCVFGPSYSSDNDGTVVVRKFYNILGSDAKFDQWGFNTYGGGYTGIGKLAAKTIAVMDSHGDTTKAVTINEFGIEALAYGPNRAKSERAQAVGLLQTHVALLHLAPRVKRISWFIANGGKGIENYPIFDLCWTPRPAAGAYMVMTKRLGAGKIERKIQFPDVGIEFFVWQKSNGEKVGIAWAKSEASATIDTGSDEIYVDDLFGNRQTVEAKNGIANIALSPDPVYIVGAKHIEISKSIELSASISTKHGDGPATVTVTMANNTKSPADIALDIVPHPCLKVDPSTFSCSVREGGKVSKDFNVSFIKSDDRRRFPIKFKATTGDGNVFETVLSSSFTRCVHAPSDFKIDGTWNGWERSQVLHADQRSQVEELSGFSWKGPDDCSAEIQTMWDERNFYIGVKVKDDVFFAQQPPNSMFLNDALEIGFALNDKDALWQLAFGQSNEGAALFKHRPAPGTKIEIGPALKIIKPGDAKNPTVYQLAIPWETFNGFKPQTGRQIGFGLIVDDSDGKPGDRRVISWFGLGIHQNNVKELGDLSLAE